MIRIPTVIALFILTGTAVGGCADAYTAPSSQRAISADIAATRVGSSNPLSRNQTPTFRDTDLSIR